MLSDVFPGVISEPDALLIWRNPAFSMGVDFSGGHESGRVAKNPSSERCPDEKPKTRSNHLNGHELGLSKKSPNPKSPSCIFNEVKVESSGVLERDSIYQSSYDIRKLMNQQKLERYQASNLSADSFISFKITKSSSKSCQSKETLSEHKRRRPRRFINIECDLSSSEDTQAVAENNRGFLDFTFSVLPEEKSKSKSSCSEVSLAAQTSSCKQMEKNRVTYAEAHEKLPRSFSAKVGTRKTLLQEDNSPSTGSQKSRGTPIIKMLSPMKKSKSQKNPSMDKSSQYIHKGQMSPNATSAAHLHTTLKLVRKQFASPNFEFSLMDVENCLSAKTWRPPDALNWVYTFNSSLGDGRPAVVGQMHASCYFCSELGTNGLLDNFAIMEFVLQDTSPLKSRSISPLQLETHPHLEIAAVVVQIPFGRNRSLRDKLRADACSNNDLVGCHPTNSRHVNVKAVTSPGRHGPPNDGGETGPSPLLDRWRSGGSCDCGGWDMACPITVLESSDATQIKGNNLSLKLFSQGTKHKIPALSISSEDEDGQYSVHFHARLSKLQAFSICVAVLHGLEAFEQSLLFSNSANFSLEEELRRLSETAEQKPYRNSHQVHLPHSPIGRV
ncbi:uncharacterized protein LOC144700011 [Wolffia australiana]